MTFWLRDRPVPVAASLLCFALTFAFAGPVSALSFQKQTLTAKGQVQHVLEKDLDGDGMNDLLATVREGKPEAPKRVLYVWRGRAKGFAAKPDMTLNLPWSTVALDACDVTASPGLEIVTVTARGLSAYPRDGQRFGPPQSIAKLRPAAPYADPADAPFLELCRKPKGASGDELWIPVVQGVQIMKRGATDGTLEKVALLPVWPVAENWVPDEFRGPRVRRDFSMLIKIALPMLYAFDADNDGDDDLYATVEDKVWLFLRDGGVLSEKAVYNRSFGTRTETEWRENKNRLQVHFGDMDGDKKPDAVVVKSTGMIQNLKTEIRVYRGKGKAGFETRPLVTRKRDGYGTPEGVMDLDGDGKCEILEPTLDTSPMAIAKLVVTQTVELEFFSLKLRNNRIVEGDGRDLEFTFQPGGSGVKGTLPLLGRDLDADGLLDRVDLGLGDGIQVVRGKKGNPAFYEDPAFEASTTSTRKAAFWALRNKGPSGFVVFSPKDPDVGRNIVVFWNTAMR